MSLEGGSEATPPRGSPFRLDFDLRGRPAGGGLRPPTAFGFPSSDVLVFDRRSATVPAGPTNGRRDAARRTLSWETSKQFPFRFLHLCRRLRIVPGLCLLIQLRNRPLRLEMAGHVRQLP